MFLLEFERCLHKYITYIQTRPAKEFSTLKKLLLTCMACVLLSAAWLSPVLAGFSDVDGNQKYAWAKPSIDEMNRRGILTGFADGSFKPDQPVTKAQFTVMVYRLFPLLRNPEPAVIPGLPENHWASKEFTELYSTTWPIYAADVQNFDDESYAYKPEKPMTRWEVLMTLNTLFSHIEGPDFSSLKAADTIKALTRVKDVPKPQFASYADFEKNDKAQSLMTPKLTLVKEGNVLDWAGDLNFVKAQALYRFMKLGIITPDAQGYFYPDRKVTRAEMVTILNRMLAAAGEDYAYVKPDESESMSGSYLTPGSASGVGSNLFYQEPETNIILSESPSWSLSPGQRLSKVAVRVQSRQVLDVFVTIDNQTTRYAYEQFENGGEVTFDVTGLKSFHVRGAARYPEQLQEDGDNEVMIYVSDPEMKDMDED